MYTLCHFPFRFKSFREPTEAMRSSPRDNAVNGATENYEAIDTFIPLPVSC